MSLPLTPTTATILLMETEVLLLRYVTTVLQRAGFDVLPAATTDHAIQISRTFQGPIHLLLTDSSITRRSGSELTSILATRPEMRALLMSGDPPALTLAKGRGWYFLGKPFSATGLLATVRDALTR